MTKAIIETAKDKMGKTAAVLKKDLSALRAGRANPQLLDRIVVDYYGTPTPLQQIANISAPEARQLVISLWDSKLISAVEKEILKSDL
nr:ribosome recycling factor [Clostridia bacterium]